MNDSLSNNIEELLQTGYRYALSLTHKHHDAEDLVQEAYMKLIRHYGIISNRKIFFTTIRNLFYDQCRRAKIIAFDPLESIVEPPLSKLVEEKMDDIESLLAILRPPEREAIYLNVVEGYTAKEIGRIMKISRNTVLSLIHRARNKLKKTWSDEPK